MFTEGQYDAAILALQAGKTQLAPDGAPCAVCGDGGHQAMDCGHNPLRAMAICLHLAGHSEVLHETLHWLAGHDRFMGEVIGPAGVRLPDAEPPEDVKPFVCRVPNCPRCASGMAHRA